MGIINWFDMLYMHIEKHHMWEYLTFMCYVRIFKITNRRKCTFNLYILTFFHFSPYILFLPLLVPKSIYAFYLSP